MNYDELKSLSLNEGFINQTFRNIQGQKSLSFSKGKVSFQGLKIFSPTNSEAFFKVTSPVLSKYYQEYSENYENSDIELNQQYAFVFSIHFRECLLGEIFISKMNRFNYVVIICERN